VSQVARLEAELSECQEELREVHAVSSPAVMKHPAFLKTRDEVTGQLALLRAQIGARGGAGGGGGAGVVR